MRNKYEIRKTIRFKLDPKTKVIQPSVQTSLDMNVVQKNFIDAYKTVINSFEKLLFIQKFGEDCLNRLITVKHNWLRIYTKHEFYEFKDQIIKYNRNGQKIINKINIADPHVDFLYTHFKEWITNNRNAIENIQYLYARKDHELKRRSDLAYWITFISKRNNFESIFELFDGNIVHSESNVDIDLIKEHLVNSRALLNQLMQYIAPNAVFGIEIERASLNYFTVNKRFCDYQTEILTKEKQLEQVFSVGELDALYRRDRFNELPSKFLYYVGFIGYIQQDNKSNNMSIAAWHEKLKLYKAEQKKLFYERVAKGMTYEELKNSSDLPLLKDISPANFYSFCSGPKKRSSHFQYSFSNYKKYCDIKKKLAMVYGKMKAEVKSLEKARIDAERTQSWALIHEKDGQKYLLTIQRDANGTMKKAKKHLDGFLSDRNEYPNKLYLFESLTLRALDKLCFGLDKNTFLPSIQEELYKKCPSLFYGNTLKRKDQLSKDNSELLLLYQTVLGLTATKNTLAVDSFIGFEALTKEKFNSLSDFEQKLKQACYIKKQITMNENDFDAFINSYQVRIYKITSYDLQKNDPDFLNSLSKKKILDRSHPEAHTKIWLDFWTKENEQNNHNIRINPEIKISYRQAEKKDISLEQKSKPFNRAYHDQYTLSTTITLNAHERSINTSYLKKREIEEFIQTYNTDFNKNIDQSKIYYYGLDRGEKELITLGVFSCKEFDTSSASALQPQEITNLEVYTIPKDQYLTVKNGYTLYRSPAEFIDDHEYITPNGARSYLDLTCAKLLKGKIVTNGDIATYLKLKEINAKRMIYELVRKNRLTHAQVLYDKVKNKIILDQGGDSRYRYKDIYFCDDEYQQIAPPTSIEKDLQGFLTEILHGKGIIPTILEINRMRDAICANAVGIISFLQTKYPGFLVLEGFNISKKEGFIQKTMEHLASRIEWKLFQKFQSTSQVPPVYRELMSIIGDNTVGLSEAEVYQLGIMLYVSEKNTSTCCPHCETISTKNKDAKFSSHQFVCVNCGYIGNSDSIAAYNIAKRGLLAMKNKF